MQTDYKRLVGVDSKRTSTSRSFGIWDNLGVKKGKISGVNMCDKLDKDLVQSIMLIVDNSGYSADYLKRCYYIEFIMILKQVSKKLKQ